MLLLSALPFARGIGASTLAFRRIDSATPASQNPNHEWLAREHHRRDLRRCALRRCPRWTIDYRSPRAGRLHHSDPSTPLRPLLPVSRTRRRQTQEGASAGRCCRRAQDPGRWLGRRQAGEPGAQRAHSADLRGRRRHDAAVRIPLVADRRREGAASALGQGGRGLPAALGVSAGAIRPAAEAPGGGLEHESDRHVHRDAGSPPRGFVPHPRPRARRSFAGRR